MKYALTWLVLSAPGLCFAAVSTYFAITVSAWWMIGIFGSALMLPDPK